MFFTEQELQAFANWVTLSTEFGRGDDEFAKAIIEPLLAALRSAGFSSSISGDPGMRNHWAIWIQRDSDPMRVSGDARVSVSGLMLLLSALGPYGAIGRSSRTYFVNGYGESEPDLDDLVDPSMDNDPFVQRVVELVRHTPYELLSPEVLMERLPTGIEPMEYCLCKSPWDRVFHVMFAATD